VHYKANVIFQLETSTLAAILDISALWKRSFLKELGFHKLQIFYFLQTRFQTWTSILNKRTLALGLLILK